MRIFYISDERIYNDTLFAVTKGTGMGVIKTNGETVLRPYHELIEEGEGLLFTLRNGITGAYEAVPPLTIIRRKGI